MYYELLRAKIADGSAVCGVVGLGYVGLPLAVEMGNVDLNVIGFDVSKRVVNDLNAGRSHIKDIPSADVARLRKAGRFEATTEMSRLAECDVISICVPTPLSKTKDPEMSYVIAATESVAASLRPGQLIVLESTTYPGTTRELMIPLLEARGLEVGSDIFLCFSPERVDPGNEKWHTKNTPKVIGGVTPHCVELGAAIYGKFIERMVPVSSPEAAELTKLLENTFRMINIGLANEMAQVCDRLGVDVWEVIDAAATKPFGYMRFTPGPGLGGHCIPLDPHYLSWKARQHGFDSRFIGLAEEVNSRMPEHVVQLVSDGLNDERKAMKGSNVLLLGVAYKKDINDVRESPALSIIDRLRAKGANVRYHDPFVAELRFDDAHTESSGEPLNSVPLTNEELQAADCVIIVTDHSDIDYKHVCSLVPLIVDTRNALNGDIRRESSARVIRL
jgi:UDP-N-acetyl-D-glucosamine dehydrogenase